MFRNLKAMVSRVPTQPHDAVRNLGAMAERLELAPVFEAAAPANASPASWPSGVSLLAQMVDACQRCETAEVCNDWLARAPNSITVPPDFCPNADALVRAKRKA
ncbi:MAG: hypothetical protein GC182_19235 [Rhodopseudomonas sp.]|nr:hypothetical protein [Rhodopseudomonas sp.]